eukprot:1649048-Pyramimonas_sp.AAC.1
MVEQICARTPEAAAWVLTSTRKKYTGGMGGRTMYSLLAAYSTDPRHSSGRSYLNIQHRAMIRTTEDD